MSHAYALDLTWEGTSTADYASYCRGFRIAIAGKPALVGSADALFRGDPALPNPEELLVAAVASCHMLVYLALCARSGVRVLAYRDAARGVLALLADGAGQFEHITLQPRVTIAPDGDLEHARALHARAAERCFIARSCNFPIHHRAEVTRA